MNNLSAMFIQPRAIDPREGALSAPVVPLFPQPFIDWKFFPLSI